MLGPACELEKKTVRNQCGAYKNASGVKTVAYIEETSQLVALCVHVPAVFSFFFNKVINCVKLDSGDVLIVAVRRRGCESDVC